MKILEEDKQISQDNKDLQEKFDFTVMSYNILSQDLLEDNSHLYKHCRHQILSWNYRFPNILSDIKRLDADVSGKLFPHLSLRKQFRLSRGSPL